MKLPQGLLASSRRSYISRKPRGSYAARKSLVEAKLLSVTDVLCAEPAYAEKVACRFVPQPPWERRHCYSKDRQVERCTLLKKINALHAVRSFGSEENGMRILLWRVSQVVEHERRRARILNQHCRSRPRFVKNFFSYGNTALRAFQIRHSCVYY